MSAIIHPKQLSGKAFKYNGVVQTASDVYELDGQFIIRTDRGKVKINKSQIKDTLNDIEVVAGSKVNGALGAPDELDPIKPKDAPADKFYGTRDYAKFVFHEKNRMVNDAHVNELVRSIKKNNLLFCQPILVNSKYEVIDGQHRLKAAIELDERIYYIIKPGLTIEDAIALNINTKNWGYKDYMDHWIAQGNENYVYFKQYLEKYGLPYSLAAGMFMEGRGISGGGSEPVHISQIIPEVLQNIEKRKKEVEKEKDIEAVHESN